MNRHSRYTLRLPAAVVVCILIPPLATVLAWSNVLRRRDLKPPHKGLWLVLCLMPILGPLLYLGIGRGKFELIPDKISGFFLAVTLGLLVVAGVTRMLGTSSHTWQGRQTSFDTQVRMSSGSIPYISQHAWSFRYNYACPGLHAPRGLPPNTLLRPALHVRVTGPHEGISMVDSRKTASHTTRFTDGGLFHIHLVIDRDCAWSLRAASI